MATQTENVQFSLQDILRNASAYQGYEIYAPEDDEMSPTQIATTTITIPFKNSPTHTPKAFTMLSPKSPASVQLSSPCALSCCNPRSCTSSCVCSPTAYSSKSSPSPSYGQTFFPSMSPLSPQQSRWARSGTARYTRLTVPKPTKSRTGGPAYAALASIDATVDSSPSSAGSKYDTSFSKARWNAGSPPRSPYSVKSPGGRSVHAPYAISEPPSEKGSAPSSPAWFTQPVPARVGKGKMPLTPYARPIRVESCGSSVVSGKSAKGGLLPSEDEEEVKGKERKGSTSSWRLGGVKKEKTGEKKLSRWARWRGKA
ncbi:hypothetical protein K461DRAFT_124086 [Myriangium duriaei CBS 260.36]|uniref:Uncharacterized protein n=1 Tax=Myriangium duriaei CBS 260.36 TaxID=1168546 RepID=A0A9P4MIH4_9PEZI|nr:hypothetical protein K461DRAFT_124086 [Myriangium duriaei CBS 260.36]